jgi:hypothetical protein
MYVFGVCFVCNNSRANSLFCHYGRRTRPLTPPLTPPLHPLPPIYVVHLMLLLGYHREVAYCVASKFQLFSCWVAVTFATIPTRFCVFCLQPHMLKNMETCGPNRVILTHALIPTTIRIHTGCSPIHQGGHHAKHGRVRFIDFRDDLLFQDDLLIRDHSALDHM